MCVFSSVISAERNEGRGRLLVHVCIKFKFECVHTYKYFGITVYGTNTPKYKINLELVITWAVKILSDYEFVFQT